MISKRQARIIREQMELHASTLTDDDAVKVPEMFPLWKPETPYAIGDRRRYGDVLYKCLQAHESHEAYTPDVAVSLWAKVLTDPSGAILPWVQPESTNPYMFGNKVTHNGKTWVSTMDYNVFEPGVVGWSVVE